MTTSLNKTCPGYNCNAKVIAKGLCAKHRARLKETGTIENAKDYYGLNPCTVDDCNSLGRVGGLCKNHRKMLLTRGTTESGKGGFQWIDKGYVQCTCPIAHPLRRTDGGLNNHIYLHQLNLFDVIGYGPHQCTRCSRHINWRLWELNSRFQSLSVYHINGNKLDNEPENLTQVCQSCAISDWHIKKGHKLKEKV